jgi:hypothetical protein
VNSLQSVEMSLLVLMTYLRLGSEMSST